jgi:hypothetical protein
VKVVLRIGLAGGGSARGSVRHRHGTTTGVDWRYLYDVGLPESP